MSDLAKRWKKWRADRRSLWYCHHDQPCYCGKRLDPKYEKLYGHDYWLMP